MWGKKKGAKGKLFFLSAFPRVFHWKGSLKALCIYTYTVFLLKAYLFPFSKNIPRVIKEVINYGSTFCHEKENLSRFAFVLWSEDEKKIDSAAKKIAKFYFFWKELLWNEFFLFLWKNINLASYKSQKKCSMSYYARIFVCFYDTMKKFFIKFSFQKNF